MLLVARVHARLRALRSAANGGPVQDAVPVAILVNSLGGLSNLELGVLAKTVAASALAMVEPRLVIIRLYAAPLMTSLDARGASVSLLPLDGVLNDAASAAWAAASGGGAGRVDGTGISATLRALDTPAPCTPWPGRDATQSTDAAITIHLAPRVDEGAKSTGDDGDAVAARVAQPPAVTAWVRTALTVIVAVADTIGAARAELNTLDSIAGDGDAGDTACRIANALRAVAASPPRSVFLAASHRAALHALTAALGSTIGEAAGGSSGILYALMLHAAAAAVGVGVADADDAASLVATAFEAALAAATSCGGAREGDRTMLDALWPACREVRRHAASGRAVEVAEAAAAAAAAGARATAGMAAAAGRAALFKREQLHGHEDAGAHAAALWLASVAATLRATLA